MGVNDDGTVEGIDPAQASIMLKELANLSNNPQKLFPTFLLNAEKIEYHEKLSSIYLYLFHRRSIAAIQKSMTEVKMEISS